MPRTLRIGAPRYFSVAALDIQLGANITMNPDGFTIPMGLIRITNNSNLDVKIAFHYGVFDPAINLYQDILQAGDVLELNSRSICSTGFFGKDIRVTITHLRPDLIIVGAGSIFLASYAQL
jgi:hypothetical protein